jgi:hypothetical protein
MSGLLPTKMMCLDWLLVAGFGSSGASSAGASAGVSAGASSAGASAGVSELYLLWMA